MVFVMSKADGRTELYRVDCLITPDRVTERPSISSMARREFVIVVIGLKFF